ncbi:MAG: nickel-dependent lactate racemase [Chloroflexota bacterium]
MTTIAIPYGCEQIALDIPADQLQGVYAPRDMAMVADAPGEIVRALSQPIAAPGLPELAAGARRVVVVADDMTRATPTQTILPVLLDGLNAAGVPDDAVEVIIALGTHRPMTAREIEIKFGRAVTQRVAVYNHDAFDVAVLQDIGQTPSGVPVSVHRRVVGADLVIGVGSIVPHHIPGYSGGAKIIQPGVCGSRTSGEVHLLSVRHPASLLGVLENRVRYEMEAIAERAGLRAILNTVLDREGRLVRAVFGDPRAAFRAGAALARQGYGVPVAGLADIVIASSHPCDIEFWQAHKTLYAAERCVRPGGTLIVVTPCPEGLAVTHPEMVEFAGRSYEELDRALAGGEIADLTAGALALAWANVRRRARVALVSGGIAPEVARAVGFEPHATLAEALAAALERHGRGASISVLPHAPDTLPLLP